MRPEGWKASETSRNSSFLRLARRGGPGGGLAAGCVEVLFAEGAPPAGVVAQRAEHQLDRACAAGGVGGDTG